MTADPLLWVLAVLQVGTAVGIAVFWTSWLRADHDTSALPPGFVEHERAFVLPDGVLAVTLTASAVLTLVEHDLGGRLALVSVGMLVFLGLLDAAYFAANGMFAAERGGRGNAAIVGWLLLLAVLLAARHL